MIVRLDGASVRYSVRNARRIAFKQALSVIQSTQCALLGSLSPALVIFSALTPPFWKKVVLKKFHKRRTKICYDLSRTFVQFRRRNTMQSKTGFWGLYAETEILCIFSKVRDTRYPAAFLTKSCDKVFTFQRFINMQSMLRIYVINRTYRKKESVVFFQHSVVWTFAVNSNDNSSTVEKPPLN